MRNAIIRICAAGALLAMASCTTVSALNPFTPVTPPGGTAVPFSSTAGQLFCAVQLAGGGQIAVALVDAEATAKLGPAAPLVAVAANLEKAKIDTLCTNAATAIGGTAIGTVTAPAAGTTPVTVAVAPSTGQVVTTPAVGPTP